MCRACSKLRFGVREDTFYEGVGCVVKHPAKDRNEIVSTLSSNIELLGEEGETSSREKRRASVQNLCGNFIRSARSRKATLMRVEMWQVRRYSSTIGRRGHRSPLCCKLSLLGVSDEHFDGRRVT